MHRGLYSSPQAVAYDLFLIWSNAREYNEQGSIVYADADKLEVIRSRERGVSGALLTYDSIAVLHGAPLARAVTAFAAVGNPRPPRADAGSNAGTRYRKGTRPQSQAHQADGVARTLVRRRQRERTVPRPTQCACIHLRSSLPQHSQSDAQIRRRALESFACALRCPPVGGRRARGRPGVPEPVDDYGRRPGGSRWALYLNRCSCRRSTTEGRRSGGRRRRRRDEAPVYPYDPGRRVRLACRTSRAPLLLLDDAHQARVLCHEPTRRIPRRFFTSSTDCGHIRMRGTLALRHRLRWPLKAAPPTLSYAVAESWRVLSSRRPIQQPDPIIMRSCRNPCRSTSST